MSDAERPNHDLARAVRSVASYAPSWLDFRRHLLRVPGVQAAMLHAGELVLSHASGLADLEAGTTLTTRHLFRVASHSKTFTATAVLQLHQAGRLRLDDPLGQWVELDGPVADVTLRELLSHSGGLIRDGIEADHWQVMTAFPDEKALRALAKTACITDRHAEFKYSNIGYSLLGLVIEAAGGQSYADYVRTHIVEPLALANTGAEYDAARADEYATGYTSLAYADTRVPIDAIDTAAMAAATGFYSTAEDLCRYVAAHFPGDERLLGDDAKRLMQHRWWDVRDSADRGYGFGFGQTVSGTRTLYGHSGGFPGFISLTMFDPADLLAFSVLTNAIDGPADPLLTGLVKLVAAATSSKTADGDGERLERFRCRLANLWGVRDVVPLGERLVLLDPTAADPTDALVELRVVDDTTLRLVEGSGYGSIGETLEFDFTADGSVRSARGAGGALWSPFDTFRTPERIGLPTT